MKEPSRTTSDILVIQPQGLSKAYKGVTALQDLNLEMPKHTIFAFLKLMDVDARQTCAKWPMSRYA